MLHFPCHIEILARIDSTSTLLVPNTLAFKFQAESILWLSKASPITAGLPVHLGLYHTTKQAAKCSELKKITRDDCSKLFD